MFYLFIFRPTWSRPKCLFVCKMCLHFIAFRCHHCTACILVARRLWSRQIHLCVQSFFYCFIEDIEAEFEQQKLNCSYNHHDFGRLNNILSPVNSLSTGSWTLWACSRVQQWSLLSSLALYGQGRTRQSLKNSRKRTLPCLFSWWWSWATSSCHSSVELWYSCLESSCHFCVSFLRNHYRRSLWAKMKGGVKKKSVLISWKLDGMQE